MAADSLRACEGQGERWRREGDGWYLPVSSLSSSRVRAAAAHGGVLYLGGGRYSFSDYGLRGDELRHTLGTLLRALSASCTALGVTATPT